jgi:hypothetical protein
MILFEILINLFVRKDGENRVFELAFIAYFFPQSKRDIFPLELFFDLWRDDEIREL